MLQTVFTLVIVLVSAAGLISNSGILQRKPRKGMFAYYTIQSNMLVLIYHLLLLAGLWSSFLRSAAVQLSVTCCITVTFIVYHFILRNAWNKMGRKVPSSGIRFWSNLCVHYFVPLLTLVEWLLTADMANVTLEGALGWLLLPILYLMFALLRGRFFDSIGNTGDRYPYPFLDLSHLGWGRLFRNLGLLLVGFFLLACLFVLMARLLA